MRDYALLANAESPLPGEWRPDDLVDLYEMPHRHFLLPLSPGREMRLDARAAHAANELMGAAEREGLTDIVMCDAWRPHGGCRALEDADEGGSLPVWRTCGTEVPLPMSGNRDASDPVPALGSHDAELGLTFRVRTLDAGERASACAWLREHGAEFGFVQRFPAGKEHLTGVPADVGCLRYVGVEAAQDMRRNGWCLEEYHAYRNAGTKVTLDGQPQDLEELGRLVAAGGGLVAPPSLRDLRDESSGWDVLQTRRAARSLTQALLAEGVVRRISASRHRDGLTLYGGVLVTMLAGPRRRVFKDLDVIAGAANGSLATAGQLLADALDTRAGDGISYQVLGMEPIVVRMASPGVPGGLRNKRAGLRLTVVANLGDVRGSVTVDAVTGRPDPPGSATRDYLPMFGEGALPVRACSPEALVATKLHCAITRSDERRIKSLYDIHLLTCVPGESVDVGRVIEAYRSEEELFSQTPGWEHGLGGLLGPLMTPAYEDAWGRFTDEHHYAQGTSWQDIIGSLSALAWRIEEEMRS